MVIREYVEGLNERAHLLVRMHMLINADARIPAGIMHETHAAIYYIRLPRLRLASLEDTRLPVVWHSIRRRRFEE